MRLELNGSLVSDHPDEHAIMQALEQLAGPDDVLTLHCPPADFVQATGNPSKGFALNAYDDAQGANLVSDRRSLDIATTAAMLTGFLRGGDWHTSVPGVRWQSGAKRQDRSEGFMGLPGAAGLIAFAIFAIPFVGVVGILQLLGAQLPLTGGDLLAGTLAIAVMSVYIGWLDFFFHSLRPRLAQRLGSRLGVRIRESFDYWDSGSWVARGGTRTNRVLTMLLDFFILLAGTVLPLGVPAVILFALFVK